MAEKDINEQMDNGAENQADFGINADENMGGSTHLTDPLPADNEDNKLKAELAEAKDKYLRLAAEFDNFRRRSAKERIETIQTAGREVINELLDVLDDAERAEKQLETSDDMAQNKQGIQLVFNKLRNVLQARGLKRMETVGQEFNPDLHEAITEIPAASDEAKGKVVDEVVKGYYLNDKIIRHAKVVVGK
ncbi:MAG: nucleotide exchange factor GrpE [Sphingobacteriales bacterium SCN 48-20]|jgi:molecular chaperone GrpE|uniref:nucleotide exchange factor GrpE n=1 Tax=Terrimonas ferruginea TaxID=249 RepID=UPI00048FCB71|nr:nucleotide exchange factor GrpE [Terrimonas ferruginea]MBN8781587.1 nucleotide exchange factor GrpE [Terrimonas ferruginea]ODT94041.1 MAG: nucleotide exchange factor GrpE [Sphingobacteriales bacterium SCN 48-20]OJW44749.1 MAG: nucleotide exchange factor GrpE [Sphingobacteriales bacterium 48-107]